MTSGGCGAEDILHRGLLVCEGSLGTWGRTEPVPAPPPRRGWAGAPLHSLTHPVARVPRLCPACAAQGSQSVVDVKLWQSNSQLGSTHTLPAQPDYTHSPYYPYPLRIPLPCGPLTESKARVDGRQPFNIAWKAPTWYLDSLRGSSTTHTQRTLSPVSPACAPLAQPKARSPWWPSRSSSSTAPGTSRRWRRSTPTTTLLR